MTYRPGRGFRVGMMRDRITVSVETTAQDAAGQPIVTLVPWLTDEPATYEFFSGGESSRGRQVEAGISAIFTVRWRSGYTPQMVVTMMDQQYGIVHVRPVDGKNRYIELFCKAVE